MLELPDVQTCHARGEPSLTDNFLDGSYTRFQLAIVAVTVTRRAR